MAEGSSGEPLVGWWKGLRRYYKEQWRLTLFACVFFAIAAMAVAAYSVAPFAFDRTVTRGTLTGVRCGSTSYSYTYSYSAQGTLYTGESGWGSLDGNPGRCSRDRIGHPAWVTFNPIHPERSVGGTIAQRFYSIAVLVGLMTVFMYLIAIPADYVKARWQGRLGKAPSGPGPLSRQYRRALERRERKASKTP
jgi:hypothetical protein